MLFFHHFFFFAQFRWVSVCGRTSTISNTLLSLPSVPNRVIHAEQHHHLTIHLQLLIHHDSVTNVTRDYFTKAAVHCGAWPEMIHLLSCLLFDYEVSGWWDRLLLLSVSSRIIMVFRQTPKQANVVLSFNPEAVKHNLRLTLRSMGGFWSQLIVNKR